MAGKTTIEMEPNANGVFEPVRTVKAKRGKKKGSKSPVKRKTHKRTPTQSQAVQVGKPLSPVDELKVGLQKGKEFVEDVKDILYIVRGMYHGN